MIWQPKSSNCLGARPLSVPWVPTGMNTGVFIGPWGRVSTETLAFVVEHLAVNSNVRADFIDCIKTRTDARTGMESRQSDQIWSLEINIHATAMTILVLKII